jgi:hypothetical protein
VVTLRKTLEAETVFSDDPIPDGVDRYAGKWIAIRGDDVVASADSLAALRQDERVSPDDTVWVVPEPGVPFL